MAWRDTILSHFPEGAYPLTVALDPDGLLLEEGVAAALDARGYTLMSYADLDPVAFRLVYEDTFRPWMPDDEARALVLRAPPAGTHALPFDIVQRGRTLRFGLDETFPSLHFGTLQALPVETLNAAEQAAPPGRQALGETETVALLLRRVYDIDPATVRAPEDLLRVLLRLHTTEASSYHRHCRGRSSMPRRGRSAPGTLSRSSPTGRHSSPSCRSAGRSS